MPASDTLSATETAPAPPIRKPDDDEIDVFGVTHQGYVRQDNQDHFLVCALRKQIAVQLSSLPDADQLMADSERLAFLRWLPMGWAVARRVARRAASPSRR